MFRMRNQIKLSQLHQHPQNPRKQLIADELAESIKESGLLSPLLVRRIGFEKFEIISGHRRKFALEKLGEKYADCDIVEMTDEQAYKALMTANIQSKTLSEIEEAEGIKHMLDAYEWTAERVSKEFGKERRWVFYRLQLLGLEPEVKEQVHARALTPTHAREIAQLPQDQQTEIARQVVEEKLSTRETADLVKQIKEPEIHASLNSPQIDDSSNHLEIPDSATELEIQTDSIALNTDEALTVNLMASSTECEIHSPSPSFVPPKPVNRRIKASDYVTKFYEFLANLDDQTIDGVIELDETSHFLAVIDKAQEQLNWMRSKVTKSSETNVVEFRRNPA